MADGEVSASCVPFLEVAASVTVPPDFRDVAAALMIQHPFCNEVSAPSRPFECYLTYKSLLKSPVGERAELPQEKDKMRIHGIPAPFRVSATSRIARAG